MVWQYNERSAQKVGKYFFLLLSKGYQESSLQKSNSHITVTEESVLLPATPLSQWGFALQPCH